MADAPKFIETIVISTRIRLARNFSAYPFPKKMDEAQAEDIVVLVREGLRPLDNFKEYNLTTLKTEEIKELQERYVISPALMKSVCGAAFVSSDEEISIMVNEEDHLRQQYICRGFQPRAAYERIAAVDESLATVYDFAFDAKLGYLTACPSNLGTGMRASVMVFLPALTTSGQLKALLPAIKEGGMTLRGAFGEGSGGEGYIYQLSNERTLGWTEMDVLSELERVTMSLCDKELRAREALMKEDAEALRDRALRAFGTLTNCSILSEEEFFAKMTDVRFGVALGFLEGLDKKGFDDFLNEMRPAAFRLHNDLKGKRERYCDTLRAEIVGQVLPELVRPIRRK